LSAVVARNPAIFCSWQMQTRSSFTVKAGGADWAIAAGAAIEIPVSNRAASPHLAEFPVPPIALLRTRSILIIT
jgi:hypothetical protein